MSDGNARAGTSRRGFLTGAAGAVIGAGALGAAGLASAAPPGPTAGGVASRHPAPHPHRAPHRHYQRGLFENAKGAKITLALASGPVTLTIADVTPLDVAAGAKAGSRLWHNAFRVDLTGPTGTDIPQGTYPVRISGRTFDLFVVPVIRTTATPRYEAIIHRAYYRRVRA